MTRRIAILAACFWLSPAIAGAQADHLKCYKIKDSLKVIGTVDLDSPQFGADPGCKISKAKLFCVPATKTNVAVVNKATGEPITPQPVTGPNPGDRICYKVKCDAPVADQQVSDQFGTRAVAKLKAALVCTPAVKAGPSTTSSTVTSTTVTTTTSTTVLLPNGSQCFGSETCASGCCCVHANNCGDFGCECADAAVCPGTIGVECCGGAYPPCPSP